MVPKPLWFEGTKGVVLMSSNGQGVLDGSGINPIMMLECARENEHNYPCADRGEGGAQVKLQVGGLVGGWVGGRVDGSEQV